MKSKKMLKNIALTLAFVSASAIVPISAHAETGYTWRKVNNNWYYTNSNGVNKTGWIYDSGNWYYCYSNGQMAKSTTIDGYYLNENGAWTLNIPITTSSSSSSSRVALTADDIDRNHLIRGDISQTTDEVITSEQLSSSNIYVSYEYETMLKALTDNLAQGRITIDEARNSCIGKVIDNKYRIDKITFINEFFLTSTGTFVEDQIRTIKGSKLYSYVPTSYYKYDRYLSFCCGNARSNEWEAMRIVIELSEVK